MVIKKVNVTKYEELIEKCTICGQLSQNQKFYHLQSCLICALPPGPPFLSDIISVILIV